MSSKVGSAANPIVLNNNNGKMPNKPSKSKKRSHGKQNNGNTSNGNGNNGSGSGAGPRKNKSKKQRKSPYPCGCKKWIQLTDANIEDYGLHSAYLQCRNRVRVGDGHVLIAYFVHNDIDEEGGDYYCPCSAQGVMDERCSGSVTYFCRRCRRSVAPEAAEAENSQ